MKPDLLKYREELSSELENILSYWSKHVPDEINGGFVGKIDHNGDIDHAAPKGSVLNARILWSFSAAYRCDPDERYIELADRAFNYIIDYFIDEQYGGVYWSLDASGWPLDGKKQVYAIAFTIYALSEYYQVSLNEQARQKAMALYQTLMEYSYDPVNGGYFEAFNRDWSDLEDLRLSEKDANEKKTMNTHLHVLEAFTTLYRIWPDDGLKDRITALIHNFTDHMINEETGNLILFFDEDWNAKSDLISYGHDIEAAWLLLEAAEVIQHEELVRLLRDNALKMAEVSKKGLDVDGGLWYEYAPSDHHLIREKHWWVQAEAMVGFYNAWQISDDPEFLDISLKIWTFVQAHLIDHEKGEWFWGVTETGEVMPNEDKVGMWKCPYHNSRACIELIKRISLPQ
ncbi:putative N-acyl-D-glucosamine 2-epimerase [Pedobacter sp. BAL39]|uniref:AGE family epimerase/isomerase n=1 Tax=Pedobacter sp. BAL39 TaxID=391596 RepID=UPI0001559C8C|nr:AGE family epimerase/isomerase [Pedobacter sp. BAL39]EDM38084.1 putative N-acyl-D-glucosamine 2-epimerase [Pedobacter sp. BAL39]